MQIKPNFLRNLPIFRWLHRPKDAPVALALLAERINLQAEHITSLELQLAACRTVLVTTLREKTNAEGALTRTYSRLAQLKRQRRHEKTLLRTWLTRCIAIHPSAN